MLTKQLYELTK